MVGGVARLLVGVVAHPALGIQLIFLELLYPQWRFYPIGPGVGQIAAPVVRALHGCRARAHGVCPALSPFLPVQSHRAPPACCFCHPPGRWPVFHAQQMPCQFIYSFKSANYTNNTTSSCSMYNKIYNDCRTHAIRHPADKTTPRTGKPGGACQPERTTHTTQRSGPGQAYDRKPYTPYGKAANNPKRVFCGA